MPSKKTKATALPPIPKELIDQFVTGPDERRGGKQRRDGTRKR